MDLTAGVGQHAGQQIGRAGPELAAAAGVLILLHGRGGDAADMLGLARILVAEDIVCLAPQAADHVWYPRPFREPFDQNEPALSSALSVVAGLVARAAEAVGARRVMLGGFSQGACLSLEFFRRTGAVAGVLGFSGTLMGPTIGEPGPADLLSGRPVFLGCSEADPYFELPRVRETAALLTAMGAVVTSKVTPGSSHTVSREEIALARDILRRAFATAP